MGNKIDLNWRDRMNTLQERAARGTAKYASKKNEDDNIEKHTQIEESREFQNEDEASQEEHDIQKDEVLKKKEMTPKGNKNSVTVRVVKNAQEKYKGYFIVTQSSGDIDVESSKGTHVGFGFKDKQEAKDWIDDYIQQLKGN